MLVLRTWLEKYIQTTLTDNELMNTLTQSGTLVDSYYHTLDDKIVVAKIINIVSHPNANKLQIATVYDGKSEYSVVCGAPNIKIGQIVPLAKIGAKIGDLIIKKAVIRGTTSFGMLCSEKELGLGKDHNGIKILDNNCQLGAPILKYFGSDLIMDLEITPNRGDCLSHFGIAREISACLNKNLSKNPISLDMISERTSDNLKLSINNSKLCPNYYARIIKNVKIAPSPDWLQKQLKLCGISPVNNVVDATNYIMLDLGQPLHAFDASKIAGKEIIVRNAKKDEKITVLDGQTYNLPSNTLVISDREKAIAIAGIIGGVNSCIDEATCDVVVEAAQFDSISIRKSSKKLGISTDASYRFERNIDANIIEYALNKASKMIKEMTGGNILNGIVKNTTNFDKNNIEYCSKNINNLLGTSISDEVIKQYLNHLGFKAHDNTIEVPSWRHDIAIWQDLAEEVVRLYGLDSVKLQPLKKSNNYHKSSYFYKEYLKDILVNMGFSENYSYAFMSEKDLTVAQISAKDLLEVANPVSPENKYLRKSLIPGTLTAIAKNPTFDPVLLFEIGNVFTEDSEISKLCIATSGNNAKKHLDKAISKIKEIFELDKVVYSYKELSRDELKNFKIKKPFVYIIEIDLTSITKVMNIDETKLNLKTSHKEIVYRPISKYPSVNRDLAFIIDNNVKSEDVIEDIYNSSNLICYVELFDEFSSDKFGINKKNLAYHIYLQANDHTLKDNEANHIIELITSLVCKKHKAKLRDQ